LALFPPLLPLLLSAASPLSLQFLSSPLSLRALDAVAPFFF
jgi:hypothetical protein